MSPAVRKLALTFHLTTSIGWVGAVIAYLGLGIAAVVSPDTETIRAAWTAMDVTGWWVIIPLAIGALATGLVMSLGTRWGLFRHYWTLISLALTVVCSAVLVVHMPSVSATARTTRSLSDTDLRMIGGDLFHPGVGLLLLLLITVLNVYKPEGLTPYGWRKQREERRTRETGAPARISDVARTGTTRATSAFSRLTARIGYFAFHFAEMWFAMLLGMAAFMVLRIAISTQGMPGLADPASMQFQVGMATFMVVPMVGWMRFRGCSWRDCAAMSGAMVLSTAALLVASALDLRDAQRWLASNQHLLMLAGMLTFMIFARDHYSSGYSFGGPRASSRRRESLSAGCTP